MTELSIPLRRPPLLLVSGPTACGKSLLGIRLARSLGGEIINIDSVQIFRGADIGSAKLPPDKRQGVAHHLLDIRSPNQRFNVAEFIAEADRAVAGIQDRNKIPILVGGTTMYVTALFHGLAALPPANEELRRKWREIPSQQLHQELLRKDPPAAEALPPNDRVRIIRALEAVEILGASGNAVLACHRHKDRRYCGLLLVLCCPRAELYRRIELRSRQLVEQGIIEETAELARGSSQQAAVIGAIGYAQAMQVLEGKLERAGLSAEIAKFTRRLAKRQMTFWRNEPAKRGWRQLPPQEPVHSDTTSNPKPRAKPKTFNALELGLEELARRVKGRLSRPFDSNEVWYINTPDLGEL